MLQKDNSPSIATVTRHTAPIAVLQFTPQSKMMTGSHDMAVRVGKIFSDDMSEVIQTIGILTAAAISPDEKDAVVASNNGEMYVYHLSQMDYVSVADIVISEDARGVKKLDSLRSAQTTNWYFETMDFSPDGSFIVCRGWTQFICVYSVRNHLLMHRFTHTRNMEFSGVGAYLKKAKDTTKADQMHQIAFGIETKIVEPEARSVRWCPTGRGSEGLLVYVTADQIITDPVDLDIEVTSDAVMYGIKLGRRDSPEDGAFLHHGALLAVETLRGALLGVRCTAACSTFVCSYCLPWGHRPRSAETASYTRRARPDGLPAPVPALTQVVFEEPQ